MSVVGNIIKPTRGYADRMVVSKTPQKLIKIDAVNIISKHVMASSIRLGCDAGTRRGGTCRADVAFSAKFTDMKNNLSLTGHLQVSIKNLLLN